MFGEFDNGTDFTDNAWEALYSAVDSTDFKNHDAQTIYKVLSERLRFISFGDYLKRYLYRKAGIRKPFGDVELNVYRQMIRDSFEENETPASFEPTTAKLSALTKNWLTQQTVSRKVVFLLGFGLGMSVDDVDAFLTKALREQSFNAKDPFEIICWYCFKNGFNYLRFEKLWNAFCESPRGRVDVSLLFDDMTIGARQEVGSLGSDAALISFVSKLKSEDNRPLLSVTARLYFDKLFNEAKELVAAIYNKEEERRNRDELARYERLLLNDDRMTDAERIERIERKRASLRVYAADDITENDLERMISSAIPVDRHGNLTPAKASKLNAQFAGKRFSRQHIGEIIAGKADVTRFDLVTLNFFIYSQTLDKHPDPRERFFSFVSSTNEILDKCSLGELYITNPYECFVLMCVLTEDPLCTYADVWEISYEG